MEQRGTVTTPRGFFAGAIYAGLKTQSPGVLDLGILSSEAPCVAAGVFTSNKVKAAPVVLCRQRLEKGNARAIVVNAGCANACTGKQGTADAQEMTDLVARKLGLSPDDVLVASTGVIGKCLPMDKVRQGIAKIVLSREGGHDLARAIITTDPFPKEIAVTAETEGHRFTIGGIAKGSGMIHPDMATMLCFLTTDAAVDPNFLHRALTRAVNASFNMITVDGDTSTNDSVILLANGLAGNQPIKEGQPAKVFQRSLDQVCVHLAREIARGGEGATRLIEVTVERALTVTEAKCAARTVAGSMLLKAAVHGGDPNWGRIVAALGRSGAELVESKIDVYLGDICLMKSGQPQAFDEKAARSLLAKPEVLIKICLNLGPGKATAWGCDLSQEYVTINSAYTT